jgi:hypothetical protein
MQRFVFVTSLMLAGIGLAVAGMALSVGSLGGGPLAGDLIVGALVGFGGAMGVLHREDERRDEAFDELRGEEVRAEQARVRAEFPEALADKVTRGALSIEEARKRHRAGQRGPDDGWVP